MCLGIVLNLNVTQILQVIFNVKKTCEVLLRLNPHAVQSNDIHRFTEIKLKINTSASSGLFMENISQKVCLHK